MIYPTWHFEEDAQGGLFYRRFVNDCAMRRGVVIVVTVFDKVTHAAFYARFCFN
jgi:hypothetical protein